MISVFPDEEGVELSTILSESVNLAELQDPSFAVPNDQVDQVIGNVEGPDPEQAVIEKSDYERIMGSVEERFRKDRAERREERREQLLRYEEKRRENSAREEDRIRKEFEEQELRIQKGKKIRIELWRR